MSNIGRVLKEKRKLNKQTELKRKQAMNEVKSDTMFMMLLDKDLKQIDIALDAKDVSEVTVEIPEKDMPRFMRALYKERMAEYEVEVIGNRAKIRKRVVAV